MFEIDGNSWIFSNPLDGIYIVDNFFNDPLEIRNAVLQWNYEDHKSLYHSKYNPLIGIDLSSPCKAFEKIIGKNIDTDTWEAYRNGFSNGYIQYMTSSQKSLVHFDSTMWGAIVYLNPSPELNSGTYFVKHKVTKLDRHPKFLTEKMKTVLGKMLEEDRGNEDKWENIFECENVFNRAIVFKGDRLHCGRDGFGDNLSNARLYQTFFFDSKDIKNYEFLI